MTASSQQGSRWGSFIQQAVAEVESRLDNILTDGAEDHAGPPLTGKPENSPSVGGSPKQQTSLPRTTSTSNRANNRLQVRLAQAIASKNGTFKGEHKLSDVSSKASSPALMVEAEEYQKGTESASTCQANADGNYDRLPKSLERLSQRNDSKEISIPLSNTGSLTNKKTDHRQEIQLSREQIRSDRSTQTVDSSVPNLSNYLLEKDPPTLSKTSADYDAIILELQSNLLTSETLRQEESHEYIEKIDALQNKLQYLAREAAERARVTGIEVSSGSFEKKLADKDQQIALLLAEGQTLSIKELNNLATIKKLRTILKEQNNEMLTAKNNLETAKNDAIVAAERLKEMQDTEKQLNEQHKLISHLKHDKNLLQSENENHIITIANLRACLDESFSQDKQEDIERLQKSLQAEQIRTTDLLENIRKLETERKLEVDKAENKIKELEVINDVNEERASTMIMEMKMEQQTLERKLESMRAKVEEASSGATGDAQARFLRQIETLQTQYSVASENWQRIEASLVARATTLEKEREEAISRESDARLKARNVTQKMKIADEELEDLRMKVSTSQERNITYKLEVENLHKRLEEAEISIREARKNFDEERKNLKSNYQNCLEEEWNPNPFSCSSAEPLNISSRKSVPENMGIQTYQNRRTSTRSAHEPSPITNLYHRRAPSQVIRHPSVHNSLSRKNSMTSFFEETDYECSHHNHDESFENGVPPTSPFQTSREMRSESKAGTGPSVQLVERMSSAIRRLECEKIAMKEDVTRLSSQRDEARTEIVNLMRELETKKSLEDRIAEYEKKLIEIKERYETTLVMLGEKSEEVDELRGDIMDIKSMYRELVERTV